MRKRVVDEILSTETSYVRSLETLVKVHRSFKYINLNCKASVPYLWSITLKQQVVSPLKKTSLKVLSDEEINVVFQNVGGIKSLYQPFIYKKSSNIAAINWFPLFLQRYTSIMWASWPCSKSEYAHGMPDPLLETFLYIMYVTQSTCVIIVIIRWIILIFLVWLFRRIQGILGSLSYKPYCNATFRWKKSRFQPHQGGNWFNLKEMHSSLYHG